MEFSRSAKNDRSYVKNDTQPDQRLIEDDHRSYRTEEELLILHEHNFFLQLVLMQFLIAHLHRR